MHLFRECGVSHAKENHHREPPAQVAIAEKAAELKAKADERDAPSRQARLAANQAYIAETALAGDIPLHRHEREHVHSARAPPVCLLDKNDILAITNVTFPTIWAWMRAGTFPRSRVVGGKSMWLSSEIEQWLLELPVRALKGDAEVGEVA
jgi:predicted DNA-binding transcriptional regulator AlpA